MLPYRLGVDIDGTFTDFSISERIRRLGGAVA